jgi:hypothetical protein
MSVSFMERPGNLEKQTILNSLSAPVSERTEIIARRMPYQR